MTTHIADYHGARRCAWSFAAAGEGSDFNVVARCLLYLKKSILAICQRRFADVLAFSDVAVF